MSDLTRLSNDELLELSRTNAGSPVSNNPLAGWSNERLLAAMNGGSGVVDTAVDVAKSSGIGLAKGAIGLAGAPGDVAALAQAGGDTLARWAGANPDTINRVREGTQSPQMPTSADIQRIIEARTGEFYKPKTQPGRFAQTMTEMVPGAAIGGTAGMPGRIAKYGLIPGAASEAAGQAVEGSGAEPYVRGGAALAAGGVGAMVTRPRTASTTIRGAIPGSVTQQQLQDAEAMFQGAARMGMPITRAEAVQYVTGGATRLGDAQRIVEGQGGMREFFSQRPQQTEAGFTNAVRQIDPTPNNQPSTIGPAVGRAAEDTINDVRGTINAASEPFYRASANSRILPADMGRLRAAPGWAEARDAVRNDPQLARYVNGLPDNSVGFVNEVKKYLDTAAENAAGPMNAQRNQQRAAGYGLDAALARQSGINASTDYEIALNVQSQSRERFLQPLLDGPLGRIASRDTKTQDAINALFPQNPIPNSADEIATAVGALAHRNPLAARQLVRAHVESVFNETTQNLISGANEFGGAKFAAAIRGNPQQAENLEAAIRALPNGDQVWTGFDRFLQVVEAQGTRQRVGSQTAFNQEVLQDLRRGTAVQEAGAAVATVGIKLPTKIKDTLERWRLGQGVEEIASLLTTPEAGPRFAQIARMPVGSNEAARIAARLVYLAGEGARSTPAKKSSNSSD